jgi:hypothetical protein
MTRGSEEGAEHVDRRRLSPELFSRLHFWWRRLDATAMGTSTQVGKMVDVKVTIYEYSPDEDPPQLLVFQTPSPTKPLH